MFIILYCRLGKNVVGYVGVFLFLVGFGFGLVGVIGFLCCLVGFWVFVCVVVSFVLVLVVYLWVMNVWCVGSMVLI